jgi:hypothetical protein
MCTRPFRKTVAPKHTPMNCGNPNLRASTTPQVISNQAPALRMRKRFNERLIPCEPSTPVTSSRICKRYASGKSQSQRNDLGFNVGQPLVSARRPTHPSSLQIDSMKYAFECVVSCQTKRVNLCQGSTFQSFLCSHKSPDPAMTRLSSTPSRLN